MELEPREKRVFDELVTAALEGRRCPTNTELRAKNGEIGVLARAGHIRSEVYERNYRVIEITHGEHKGKRTAEHPKGYKPYRVLDSNGDQWKSRMTVGQRLARKGSH